MLTEAGKGLPIAETFHSIQGEGTYVGTPMHFIRLAGCPVGFKATEEAVTALKPGDHEVIPVLESGRRGSLCKTWDGRRFTCDTDFSCHTYKTVDELIGETWEKHICLTGGEPLIHQQSLIPLGFFQKAFQKGIMIHIETSGTIMLAEVFHHDKRVWITVSPKFDCKLDMLCLADEIKLLVDENFDPKNFFKDPQYKGQIFLSPINGEKEVNQKNVELTLKWLEHYPTWRLSAQWHKFLNLR